MNEVLIASDHAWFKLKKILIQQFQGKLKFDDLGAFSENSVDYPDFAKKIAIRVKSKKSNIGILICGSGTGMAISANKTKGIRAAVGYNIKSTQLSRQHNNANVLCLGSRLTKRKDIKKIIKIFLNTKFEGGRHKRRVKKI